jgi:SHS2 domain-containing protein
MHPPDKRSPASQVARSRVVPGRRPVGVRFLDHTADTGIAVRAPTLAGCFARAAAGMFACFTAPRGRIAPTQRVTADVVGEGFEDLMVAWLDELLYRSEVEGLALHEFAVSEVARTHVHGSARGVKFGRDAEAMGPGVKAVTRHGLEVVKRHGHWSARIFFDV